LGEKDAVVVLGELERRAGGGKGRGTSRKGNRRLLEDAEKNTGRCDDFLKINKGGDSRVKKKRGMP